MDMHTVIDTIAARVPTASDPTDYVGYDGIIYCGHCKGAKETILDFGFMKRKVPCICNCGKQRRDENDRKRNAEQKRMRIKYMQELGLPGKEQRNWTFENDDGRNPELMNAMRKFVEEFDWFYENKKGLLLWGGTGSGKSFAAIAAANALINMDRSCLVTSFTRIAHKLNDQRYGKQDYLDNLNTFDLLVIDDLGAERNSEYMQEIVFDIINTRYNSGKPFIITTNLTIEEIKKPAEISNARIYDRILERCFPNPVNGASRRRIKAADDYYETQKKLGLI